MRQSYLSIVFFVLLISCSSNDNRLIKQKLSIWDADIETNPSAIKDSLKTISPEELSRENRAYYNLLKVISDDKTYVNFKNDSLINTVVRYYNTHSENTTNYIRALIYQGVVRTRLGISDSTIYEPLKNADKLLRQQAKPEAALGYMINFFLGNVHYNQGNYNLAKKYFQHTLNFAQKENDMLHIFDTYLALYWNEMIQSKIDMGEQYLDTLSSFYKKLPAKRYFILNAQSVYYDARGDYKKALEKEKALLDLASSQKEKVDIAKLYFLISDRFKSLNQLDRAIVYSELEIEHINDSINKFNHIFFNNIASIAEKQNDFKKANEYRKKSFKTYQSSEERRLDTHIIELEKKYDLSEAENTALKSRQNLLIITIISLTLIIILTVLLMINWRNKRKARMELIQAEHKAEKQALQTKLLTEEANKRTWLMQLYGYTSERLTSLQEEFQQLSQRYISSQPKIYEEMMHILNHISTELRETPSSLIPDDETFYIYTRLKLPPNLLNSKEKIVLMLMICKADNRQIATFMNTTLESIRVRKSQLKKKLAENGVEISYF